MSSTSRLSSDERRAKKRARDKKHKQKWRAANPGRDKDNHLQRRYGITREQWDELFAAQGSSCAICHTTDKPKLGWHTDHCHTTGAVRGVLCHHCNLLLGYARDNPSTLAAGIAYLKDHHGAD